MPGDERLLRLWREIGSEAAIAAHERGVLSEGQVAKMLGIGRVEVRKLADDLRNDGGLYHDGLSRKIVRAVAQRGECSPSDVANAIGEGLPRVAQNMYRMHARGRLVRVGYGRYTVREVVGDAE